jgi:cytosine/adenosine deaminase-related metal-dependent hydrolase
VSTGVIRNVMTAAGLRDIAFVDGIIVDAAPAGVDEVDGTALVAISRLSDSHLHLDKALLGGKWYPHRPGSSIADRIDLEITTLAGSDVEDTYVRAERLLRRALANGSTRIRSHVDISAGLGLTRLEALLRLREAYKDLVDITYVAFPQEGIIRSPGTRELLDAALSMGVEAVGGLDPVSRDGNRTDHLDAVFELAADHGSRIDIHLHEPGEIGAETMREIASRTASYAMRGKVVISHGYCLGMLDAVDLKRTGAALTEAGITLITNVPGHNARPPVDALIDLGLNVVFASDNVRDSWSPYGKADMLERVALAGYLFGWDTDEKLLGGLERVTIAPSVALGDAVALLRPGDPADFSLVSARSVQEAIVMQPPGRTVYKAGRVVVHEGQVVAREAVSAS